MEQRLPGKPAPRTLYLGGGTPSMLSPKMLQRLFDGLHRLLDFSALEEVTLEANPATFALPKARLFLDLGITRVSLGVQSLTSHVLTTLGREHDPAQAKSAVRTLRRAGIPSINIDLMFSIPGQSLEDWQQTLNDAIALEPDHISAYNLTYEEDTAFFTALRNGTMHENPDHDAEFFYWAAQTLTAAGFEHYETSNYARPRHQSIHNQGYWQGENYLGIGPSAVTTIDSLRSQNLADTKGYVDRISRIGNAMVDSELLDEKAIRIERIALGLRTKQGVAISWLDGDGLAKAKILEQQGLLKIDRERVVLIDHGRALVDPIAAEII